MLFRSTDVAQILGMERGISKEITGRKHLSAYEYKKMLARPDIAEKMALEKPEIIEKVVKKLTLKKLKEMNQEVRDELKKLGASREDYAELEAIKKAVEQKLKAKEPLTFENVDRQFSEFLEAFKNEIKSATEGAIINSINTLKCDKKQDGGVAARARRESGARPNLPAGNPHPPSRPARLVGCRAKAHSPLVFGYKISPIK